MRAQKVAAMSHRKVPVLSFRVSSSVQFTFVTLAGVSAGYLLWKWLDGGDDLPKIKTKKRKKTVPGLLNVGNNCFMNALLQAFASCPSYVQWLERFIEETHKDKDHIYLAQILLKILKTLTGDTDIENYFFDPSELLQDMGGRGWQISSQEQDAHEFYHAVMTTLIEEYKHHVSKGSRQLELFEIEELLSRPPLFYPFGRGAEVPNEPESQKLRSPCFRGTLACILQCQTCGYQNPVRYDGFDSLSLPLPSGLPWNAEITLMDCLRGFTASELVQNVECENCAKQESIDILKKHCENFKQEAAIEDRPNQNEMTENKLSANCTQVKNSPTVTVPHKDFQDDPNPSEAEMATRITPDSKLELTGPKVDSKKSKPPFPRLTLTSQKVSFERYFHRRFHLKTTERTEPLISVKQPFYRRLSLGKLPDCLCIHLQRLVWMRGTPMKKMNFVKFPEILDVNPFTKISRVINSKGHNSHSWFEDDLKDMRPSEMHKFLMMRKAMRSGGDSQNNRPLVNPPISLQGGSIKSPEQRTTSSHKSLYKLMSAIVHVGDWSFSGHFLSYRRTPDSSDQTGTSDWIFTSDTMVRRATKQEVFSCPAYMLFYERIKP